MKTSLPSLISMAVLLIIAALGQLQRQVVSAMPVTSPSNTDYHHSLNRRDIDVQCPDYPPKVQVYNGVNVFKTILINSGLNTTLCREVLNY